MSQTVCVDCVDDEFLKAVVRENTDEPGCSFCEGMAPASPLEPLVEAIDDALRTRYCDAAEVLPYESREGGYQGKTFTTWELLDEIDLSAALADDRQELFEAICAELEDLPWCERDQARLTHKQKIDTSWEQFTRYIKHERRFFFLQPDVSYVEDDEFDPLYSPAEMLDALTGFCCDNGLVVTLERGQKLFRARRHEAGKDFTTARDLGPPPARAATQNRMSPAGIPMTYLTDDPQTAVAELAHGSSTLHGAAIGVFSLLADVKVVDLSASISIPSFFDSARAEKRDASIFLHRFTHEVSRPARSPERIHIDYIPTQVVTEYFRFSPRLRKLGVAGLRYRSSQAGGTCIVLFGGQEIVEPSRADTERLDKMERLAAALESTQQPVLRLEQSYAVTVAAHYDVRAESRAEALLRRRGISG